MSKQSLWIGDIDPWMDEQTLMRIFESIAHVKSVKIIVKNGLCAGYGFIEFINDETATEVLHRYNGKRIEGYWKPLKLARANFNVTKFNEHETQIYVCDMDLSVNEDQLREFFHGFYPSVVSAKIIYDRITRLSKGYGFVKFSSIEEANAAVTEMNGRVFFNKRIRVRSASYKEETASCQIMSNILIKEEENFDISNKLKSAIDRKFSPKINQNSNMEFLVSPYKQAPIWGFSSSLKEVNSGNKNIFIDFSSFDYPGLNEKKTNEINDEALRDDLVSKLFSELNIESDSSI